jgi:hypothetical protein
MASAPDIASMMPKNEPSKVEQAQQRMGAERSEWSTRVLAGEPGKPGVARLLSKEIDQMYSPARLARERGKMNVGLQQQFGGAKTLRDMALKDETNSGLGNEALRGQYSALASAREQGATGVQNKAQGLQAKARIGFVKLGEGMTDTVSTHLSNLGEMESKRARTLLEKAATDADTKLRTQVGLMGIGTGLLGAATSAGTQTLSDGGGWTDFGKNLATGLSGGVYRS